jgi:hypothetical protein
MQVSELEPPRTFSTGQKGDIAIRHCADLSLEPDEMVTFLGPSGSQYDVARKSWGYYATPSINGRLANFGLRGVLVRNQQDKLFLLLVEKDREAEFQAYLNAEHQEIVGWLDDDRTLTRLYQCFGLTPANQ